MRENPSDKPVEDDYIILIYHNTLLVACKAYHICGDLKLTHD